MHSLFPHCWHSNRSWHWRLVNPSPSLNSSLLHHPASGGPCGPGPHTHTLTLTHLQTSSSSGSRSTASDFHCKSESCIVPFSRRLMSLRRLPCVSAPMHRTPPLLLILPEPRNQPKREKYFCTLSNKIFMDHKGFFMCLPLIIEETLFSLSDEFNV